MNMQLQIDPETNAPVFYGRPLTFNEAKHQYKWGGEWVPSVTTILQRLNKPALIQWAANCAIDYVRDKLLDDGEYDWRDVLEDARTAHARVRDSAGDVGTLVHKIAKNILGENATWAADVGIIPAKAQNALKAFEDWRSRHEIEPIALERRIFSQEYQYAGTCDYFGYIDGALSWLDFKTGGARIYDEAWLQTAGYRIAMCEELGISSGEPLNRWVVHLDKNTGKCTARVRPSELWEIDRLAWLSVVTLDRCMRQIGKAA